MTRVIDTGCDGTETRQNVRCGQTENRETHGGCTEWGEGCEYGKASGEGCMLQTEAMGMGGRIV